MKRLKRLMQKLPEPAGAFLVTSFQNRYYLTGLASSAGMLVVLRDEAFLLVDSRYLQAAREHAADCTVLQAEQIEEALPKLLQAHGVQDVYVETHAMSMQSFLRWEKLLEPAGLSRSALLSDTLYKMRRIKDAREIAALKKAQEISDRAFEKALEIMRPGISELDVMMAIGQERTRLGCETRSFNMMFSSGADTALPHGNAKIRTIEDGDLVMIDMGSTIDGYTSDMTRTVVVGHPQPEQREVYETVLRAQQAALGMIKPGAVCREVDAAARAVIACSPYASACFEHGLGHSLGLEIHEGPRFNRTDGTVLQPGMVITVEPGIYIPGKFGVRIEDMVLITEDGYENLTGSSKEWTVLS